MRCDMINQTDPYEIRVPQFNLEVKCVTMLRGNRVMLLRPIKSEIRNFRGRMTMMTLYETFNFSPDEKGYWIGWIPND